MALHSRSVAIMVTCLDGVEEYSVAIIMLLLK